MLQKIKAILKLKRTWAILIVVVIFGFVAYGKSRPPKIDYVTEPAKVIDLLQTVSATGAVESTAQLNLNMQVSGVLRELLVREGTVVEAGQELARLDTNELDKQVARAEAEVASARANLSKVAGGATKEDIAVSQEQVNSAKIAYDNAVRDDAALLAKLDADIATAQTNLADTTQSKSQAIIDARTNFLISVETKLYQADHALDQVQVIFDDIDLRPTFSVSNQQYRTDASNNYDSGLIKVKVAQQSLAAARADQSDASFLRLLQDAITAFTVTSQSLSDTFLAVGASLTNAGFTPAEQEAYKASIKTEQGKMDAAITAVESAHQAHVNARLSSTSSINAAQSSLLAAQTNKTVQLAASQSKIDSAKAAYDLAVAQLRLKSAPARASEVAYYQGLVAQAQASLAVAANERSKYILTAPANGTITFVNYKAGELVPASIGSQTAAVKPLMAMLGNAPFQIKVDIPESDITKVKLGDEAHITLDAYDESTVVRGHVSYIDVAETIIQDVVYYKVTVEIEPAQLLIKSGMTANVDIIADRRNGAVAVPQRAIRADGGARYVRVLVAGQPQRRDVTTGMRGDDGLIEVVSGVSQGDAVIIFERQPQ